MTTLLRQLTIFTIIACLQWTCKSEFLSDTPSGDCSLCDEDEVVLTTSNIFVGGTSMTCEQVDKDAKKYSWESGQSFLSQCQHHRERYREQCCAKDVGTSDPSVTLYDGGVGGKADSEDTLAVVNANPHEHVFVKESSEQETEPESLSLAEWFGIRREDPWSNATKSWPTGCFSLFVPFLALLMLSVN